MVEVIVNIAYIATVTAQLAAYHQNTEIMTARNLQRQEPLPDINPGTRLLKGLFLLARQPENHYTMKTKKESSTKTLPDLFLAELADMYDAEHRIAKALPKIAKAAVSEELKQAVLIHLVETKDHAIKLEKIFALLGEKPKAKTCEATVGLLEEADRIAADFKGSPANDAALISAMQKVEHYEIASYGCLHAWAVLMENTKAAEVIATILEQELAANNKLSLLAESSCNEAAWERNKNEKSPKKPASKLSSTRKKQTD